MKLVNIAEEKIWDQFEPAVEALTISQKFANDITAALNETHEKQKAAIKKQMEGYRVELRGLEGKEDSAYQDLKKGLLDEVSYQRQIDRVHKDRQHFENEIERLSRSPSVTKPWCQSKKCSNWLSMRKSSTKQWILKIVLNT